MTERHEPDPRFLESLEGQLGRELRRQKRTYSRSARGLRVLKTAAIVLVSVAAGAGAMGATQQLGESWRKELAEARLEVELQLAQQVLQTRQQSLDQMGAQVERGLRSERNLASAKYQFAEAEGRLRTAELKLDEIRHSGREPQDALSAPLVDGRDYVSDRIRVRMDVALQHLDLVQQAEEQALQRADLGLITREESEEEHLVAMEAELDLQSLTRELELRRASLDSEILPVEAELKLLEVQSQNRVVLLGLRYQYFQGVLQHFQEAMSAGSMNMMAAGELQTQVAEVEAQLNLAEAELRIVRQELERRASLR